MNDTIISVEHLSKQYMLGQVGTGTFHKDLNRWWHKIRGKQDPYLKLVQRHDISPGKNKHIWSLNDINFEIKKGDSIGIIGRNGSGKSTLLKILSRITAPTIGKIKIKGRIGSLLEVGIGFHPELTGRENVFLNGAILGMSKAEVKKQLDEIVAFAGVNDFIDTPVKRYSSGMYVRLAFGVAAHLEPEILIVDEVLAVGDIEFQRKAMQKMNEEVKEKGRTVLFVSHNMQAIRSLCNQSILLDKGSMVLMDQSEKVIHAYVSTKMEEGNGAVAIADRKDRTGNGLIRVTDICMYTPGKRKERVFVSEEKVHLEIKYFSTGTFCDVDFWIGVLDKENRTMFRCNLGTIKGRTQIVNKGAGFIRFNIQQLRLSPGAYHMDLEIREHVHRFDRVEGCISFEVEAGDFYKTLQLPTVKDLCFYVDYDCDFETGCMPDETIKNYE